MRAAGMNQWVCSDCASERFRVVEPHHGTPHWWERRVDRWRLKAISLLERLIEFLHPGDVNEDGPNEVAEFVPTRAELLELAKHWELTFLQCAYFVFWTRRVGITDIRLAPFAERRVMRIIELLGQDAIRAVREERDAFAKSIVLGKWRRSVDTSVRTTYTEKTRPSA